MCNLTLNNDLNMVCTLSLVFLLLYLCISQMG